MACASNYPVPVMSHFLPPVSMKGARSGVSRRCCATRDWTGSVLYREDARLFLVIYSERPSNQFHQFSLRIHPSRLPLEPEDGQEVMTRKIIQDGGASRSADLLAGISSSEIRGEDEQAVEYWEIDPAIAGLPSTSFLRLFIHQDDTEGPHLKVLIDPAPVSLNLGTWTGERR